MKPQQMYRLLGDDFEQHQHVGTRCAICRLHRKLAIERRRIAWRDEPGAAKIRWRDANAPGTNAHLRKEPPPDWTPDAADTASETGGGES